MAVEALLASKLNTRFVGRKVFYFPSLPSTMDRAHEEARARAAEGAVVIAGEQTAGRGRLNRTWYTPRGNIAASLILRPEGHILKYVVMISALSICRAIEGHSTLKPTVKWPNDVLIGGKKVAGILIENGLTRAHLDHSIVGIGLNVSSYPSELADIATSLARESGTVFPPEQVLAWILNEFEVLYVESRHGKSPLDEWRRRLETLGKRVTAKCIDKTIAGFAEGTNEDGNLILRLDNGGTTTIIAGDVTLVR